MQILNLIIPIYNSNYMEKQLLSIKNLISDLFILNIFFIDDGSDELHRNIYNYYINKFNWEKNINIKIKYFYLWEKNYLNRVCLARNKWVELSESEYLFFIDQDTILHKNYFKNIKDFLNLDVIIWPYLWYNNLEKSLNQEDINFFIKFWTIKKQNFSDFRINFYKEKQKNDRIWEFFCASNFFIKKEFYLSVWWFDETITSWGDEDVEFWYRLCESWYKINFLEDFKVLNISSKLYKYPYKILENDKINSLSENWLKNLKKHKNKKYLNYVLDRYNNLDLQEKELVWEKFKEFIKWLKKIY